MNSILKSAAKRLEELNELSGMNEAKQDGMQHTNGKLREVLKKKLKNKVKRGNTQEMWIDYLLVKKTRFSGHRKVI